MFKSYIKFLAFNSIFRDIYSKLQYFQSVTLIAKFNYKYLKYNISYELNTVIVLILKFRKVSQRNELNRE